MPYRPRAASAISSDAPSIRALKDASFQQSNYISEVLELTSKDHLLRERDGKKKRFRVYIDFSYIYKFNIQETERTFLHRQAGA